MTVAELVAALGRLPGDMPVLVHGYESGYNDAKGAAVIYVTPCPVVEWYTGQFDGADAADDGAAQMVVVE